MLLTDGEPHDVDIHDPRYLPDDLAHALAGAGRAGIATACLHVSPDGNSPALRRVFASGLYLPLRQPDRLAEALCACIAAIGRR